MSILFDTKAKCYFIDHECDFEKRASMYNNDPERIYECCCREHDRVQLKLTAALHFYPVDRSQIHEKDCERSSDFQENLLFNKAFLRREDGTFFTTIEHCENNLPLHNCVDRKFPTQQDANFALSFSSFAKKINMVAYERMMKTNRKDKNGNHSTIDRKYIERYIWSVLQNTYVLHEGKQISVYDLDNDQNYKFRYNYHILDGSKDIISKFTSNNKPYYIVPIVNLKGFGSNNVIIKKEDLELAKAQFKEEYGEDFDHQKHNIMMFVYGEKNPSSKHDINPWKKTKVYLFIVSKRGLYASSTFESIAYDLIEDVLMEKETEGKHLQFYKPYEYNPMYSEKEYLPDGVIKGTLHGNKSIIVKTTNNYSFVEACKKNKNLFLWNFNDADRKRMNLSLDKYVEVKKEQLNKIVELCFK